MSAVAKARYFWRSAGQGLRHAPFVHVIAVITIAIALFTGGLARAGARVLDGLLSTLGGEVQLTVYLRDGATVEEAQGVSRILDQKTHGESHVISPDEALGRLSKELGDVGSVLGHLPENPLPASVELKLPRDQRDPVTLKRLATEIRAMPEVSAVDYGEEAVERLSALSRAARIGGLLASLIIGFATVIIISATLQLAIYARREEIEIQKLVGATDRFVKAPFLLEGILQGLLGATVAAAALWTFGAFAAPRLGEVLSFLSVGSVPPQLLTGSLVAELFGAGAALGLCGSFVAVGRFLRV